MKTMSKGLIFGGMQGGIGYDSAGWDVKTGMIRE
jgi:hypothetical protein